MKSFYAAGVGKRRNPRVDTWCIFFESVPLPFNLFFLSSLDLITSLDNHDTMPADLLGLGRKAFLRKNTRNPSFSFQYVDVYIATCGDNYGLNPLSQDYARLVADYQLPLTAADEIYTRVVKERLAGLVPW